MDTLHRALELPWDMSCVHFSYAEDVRGLAVEEYFTHRKIPVVFFVCRPRFASGEDGYRLRSKIHSLDDICVKDAERE